LTIEDPRFDEQHPDQFVQFKETASAFWEIKT
jgi:hypothetical protein